MGKHVNHVSDSIILFKKEQKKTPTITYILVDELASIYYTCIYVLSHEYIIYYYQLAYTDFLDQIVLRDVTTPVMVVTMSMVYVILAVTPDGGDMIAKMVMKNMYIHCVYL